MQLTILGGGGFRVPLVYGALLTDDHPDRVREVVLHDTDATRLASIERVLQQMGADHVVIGTDYPFDMGHYDPLGQIDGVRGVSDEDKELIRSATASKLLKRDG